MSGFGIKSMMRVTVALTLLAMVASAGADEIKIDTVNYAAAQIRGIDGGNVVFVVSGRQISKPINQIVAINISGNTLVNSAEQALAGGKAAEAAALYERALPSTPDPLKNLVRIRRLTALDQAGAIDSAVELWLGLVDSVGANPAMLELAPSKFGQQGSAANKRAIGLLEARQKKISDSDKAQASAVNKLLLGLYEAQGQQGKAQDLAGEVVSAAGGQAPAAGSPAATLAACRNLVRGGKAGEALPTLNALLTRLDANSLPEAMNLAGLAQQSLAASAQGSAKRDYLLKAGVSHMKVFAHFPSSPQAPSSLLEAARINIELGNATAGQRALELVVSAYGQSSSAAEAAKMLQELKSK